MAHPSAERHASKRRRAKPVVTEGARHLPAETPPAHDAIRLEGADWLIALGLALITVAVFLPALANGFVWDDDVNFVGNPSYRGLGWTQLRWMFTSAHLGHYIPLTWMTLGFDHVLWGMNPRGYHATNLLLHAANAGLLYLLALRLMAAAWPAAPEERGGVRLGAAGAALLFALHPLRVESVAWITERRDVLSGLLAFLTVLAYLRACRERAPAWRRRWYWVALGLFVLALLSKSMLVTLPVILLVLDVYPLRRLSGDLRRWVEPAGWPVLAEKIPFVLASLAASVVALLAVREAGAAVSLSEVGWAGRAAIVAYGFGFYLWKTLAPLGLSPLYEVPSGLTLFDPRCLLGLSLAVAISALVIARRRRWPWLTAAWVTYLVTLLPVVGIVHNGPQIAADRYSYLPTVAWALLAGAGVRLAWRLWQTGRLGRAPAVALAALGIACLVALAGLTWRQIPVWRDAEALWGHALRTAPSGFAHASLGVALAQRGRLDAAIAHYRDALRIKPSLAIVHYNLANALADQGHAAQAVTHYREALRLRPGDPDTHYNLAFTLAAQGQTLPAIDHYRQALQINPRFREARANLDRLLRARERAKE